MKMQLITLSVDHFKCYEHRQFRFDGRNAAVCGENGTGKTTVYDAFTWLLFGKDSKGDQDFQFQPVFREGEQAGEVRDHGAVTAVEATVLVDGGERRFRRACREVWSVRRGGGEAVFGGHSSDYWVDGLPVKKAEFDRRVAELVPEDKFRLLTSLSYFSRQLPWRDRRAVLFDVAGVAAEREILASDARFAPLAAALEGLSVDDFRKKLKARRKGLNRTREDTPARLDECGKTVEELSGIDFEALEREREGKSGERDALRARLEAAARCSGSDGLDEELLEARSALQKLEADNAARRAKPEEAALRQEAAGLRAALKRQQRDLMYMTERVQDLDGEVALCRRQREQFEAETFHGELCPCCGQRLPEDKLAQAKARFDKDRAARMTRAEAALQAARKRRGELREDVARVEQERDGNMRRLREVEARLDALRGAPEPAGLPGYERDRAALEQKISDLLERRESRVNAAALRRKVLGEDLRRAEAELDELSRALAGRAALDAARRRMDELRAQAQAAAQELAGVDRLLALCDAFTRYKIQFIEESINRRFSLVRFRLFREQCNGGIEDCCDVLVDGAAVGNSLNTGAEFQAGVDIINTLSRCYGLYVPLFIDGAESVTEPLRAVTQTIRLSVAPGELKLEQEE